MVGCQRAQAKKTRPHINQQQDEEVSTECREQQSLRPSTASTLRRGQQIGETNQVDEIDTDIYVGGEPYMSENIKTTSPKEPSEKYKRTMERRHQLNQSRAKWFAQYMNNELPSFYAMKIPKKDLLDREQQAMLSRLVQAGNAARCLLHQVDPSVNVQESIKRDESAINEELKRIGYVAKDMTASQLNRARLILEDSIEARHTFAIKNLGLVTTFAARKRKMKGLTQADFEEMVESGKRGLMTAIDKFNPDMGFLFSTPAFNWIRQGIEDYTGNEQIIRMPPYMNSIYKNILYAERELGKIYDNDDDITDERIAEYLQSNGRKITLAQIQKAREYRVETISFETTQGNEENDRQLIDIVPSNENVEREVIENSYSVKKFDALLNLVDDADAREVLREWYSAPAEKNSSLVGEIAERRGISRSEVRKLRKQGEEELREKLSHTRVAASLIRAYG